MEVQAEYFPPKEDIMLQNEGAADIYIIVSGVVVRFFISDCVLKTYLYRFVQQANYTFLVALSVEFDKNNKW